VTFETSSQLTQRLQLCAREVARKRKHCIKARRGMTLREYENIAFRPIRLICPPKYSVTIASIADSELPGCPDWAAQSSLIVSIRATRASSPSALVFMDLRFLPCFSAVVRFVPSGKSRAAPPCRLRKLPTLRAALILVPAGESRIYWK
jgi:hypothetical protein